MQKPIEEGSLIWVTLRGKRFCFHTDGKETLDAGTELLIEHMDIAPTDMVLDFSCGYGAKGIVAASLATQGHVHMVDTEISAMTLALENAKINYVKKRTEGYISDKFTLQEGRTFHTILFVMPEGMNKDSLTAFVTTAKSYLKLGGKLYLSTPTIMKHVVKDLFEKRFGNYEKIFTKNGYMLSIGVMSHNSKVLQNREN